MTDPILAYYYRCGGERVGTTNDRDSFSEEARLALLNGVRPLLMRIHTVDDQVGFISGALLGLVMACQAASEANPGRDWDIRDDLVEMIPWAIDSARLHDGLPPLEDVQ